MEWKNIEAKQQDIIKKALWLLKKNKGFDLELVEATLNRGTFNFLKYDCFRLAFYDKRVTNCIESIKAMDVEFAHMFKDKVDHPEKWSEFFNFDVFLDTRLFWKTEVFEVHTLFQTYLPNKSKNYPDSTHEFIITDGYFRPHQWDKYKDAPKLKETFKDNWDSIMAARVAEIIYKSYKWWQTVFAEWKLVIGI